MNRTLSALELLFLSSWLAVVCGAALSAGVIFTTLPPLEPSVPGYEALDVETRSRLVAGLATEPVFLVADMLQLVLCPLVIIVLLLQGFRGRLTRPRVANWVRNLAIALATLVFLGRWAIVNPPMNEKLDSYRSAARAGDVTGAHDILAQFETWHHLAEGLWGLVGIALLTAIAATGVTLSQGARAR